MTCQRCKNEETVVVAYKDIRNASCGIIPTSYKRIPCPECQLHVPLVKNNGEKK